jgi:FkbM family methyltransferase
MRRNLQMISQNLTREEIERIGLASASNGSIATILGDFNLYCYPDEKSLGQWLSSTGFWESWITAWVLRNIEPGDICLDVGANYGYFSRIMQRIAGPSGFVYAIEANPRLATLFLRSLQDFPMENGSPVVVLPVAGWHTAEFLNLSFENSFLGGAFVSAETSSPSPEITSILVPGCRLEDVIGRQIDFLKMDIEGAEPFCWEGMRSILTQVRVGIIEISHSTPKTFIDDLCNDFELSLVDYSGFELTFAWDRVLASKDPMMLVIRK